MALQVWLPLNGNTENKGLLGDIASYNVAYTDNGKIGSGMTTGYMVMTADQASKTLNNSQFSLCFWIYVNTDDTTLYKDSMLFGTGGMESLDNRKYSIFQYPTANDIHWSWMNDEESATWAGGVLSGVLPAYKWTHVCVTYDNPYGKWYINGELYRTFEGISSSSTFAYSTTLMADSSRRFLNDYRIYDHCLSKEEVKEISKGLVLHYPLNDPYIENTTNINDYITQGISDTCYNGSTGKYGYGTSTDIYKTTGVFQGKQCTKVYMGTAGLSASPYVFFTPLHPSNGTYKALSFDYFPTLSNSICFYTYNGSATCKYSVNGSKYADYVAYQNIPVNLNQWNHVELVLYGTSDSESGWGYMPIGTHTSTTTDYWLFANVQIENKDHATPYTTSSRSETTLYDVSGYGNDATVTNASAPIVSQNSIRYDKSYSFDGTNTSIMIPVNNVIKNEVFTMNVWIYKDGNWGSKGWETIFGGPSGFEYQSKRSGTASPVLVAYSWGQSSSGGQSYDINKWNMVTMVRTSSECKFYLNGELYYTGSAGSIPTGNYFIGSWSSYTSQNYKGLMSDFRLYTTALSASDIKDLYQTSAKICKNGTLMCYEIKED